MALIAQQETVRLQLPATLPGIADGDWIEISCVYTAGIRRRTFRRSFLYSVGDASARQFDVYAWRQALLEEIVKAWSAGIDVTPENIEQLHPDVQDWIAAEFDRLTASRTDEKKVSSDAPPSSPTGQDGPASPQSSLT